MGIALVTPLGQQPMSGSASVVLASDEPIRQQLDAIRRATNDLAVQAILAAEKEPWLSS